jgi:ABC-type multidrug transport system ATPase subunit
MRLEVDGLTKEYPGGWGIHEVSFAVPAGQIVTLGGPNGSGKSTVLKCIAGLVRCEGTVRMDGSIVDGSLVARAAIGYLPQVISLPEQVTIGEMIRFFADLRGVLPDTTGLPEGFLREDDATIGSLSGGQRHRIAMAIALLGSPRLLLLDEPVANLDDDGRAAFWQVLHGLRDERGVSALVSSPAPSELRGIADRGIAMVDGRIVRDELFPHGLHVAQQEPGEREEASA